MVQKGAGAFACMPRPRLALAAATVALALTGCAPLQSQTRGATFNSIDDCRTRSDCVVPVTVGAVAPGSDHDCGIGVVDAIFIKTGVTRGIVFSLRAPGDTRFEYRFPELRSPNDKVGIFVYPDGPGQGPAFERQRTSAASFTLTPLKRSLGVNAYGIYLQYRRAGAADTAWVDCKEYDPIIISMD